MSEHESVPKNAHDIEGSYTNSYVAAARKLELASELRSFNGQQYLTDELSNSDMSAGITRESRYSRCRVLDGYALNRRSSFVRNQRFALNDFSIRLRHTLRCVHGCYVSPDQISAGEVKVTSNFANLWRALGPLDSSNALAMCKFPKCVQNCRRSDEKPLESTDWCRLCRRL